MGASSFDRGRPWQHEGGPDRTVERYRAWITTKVFQGIGILVLLMAAVIVFDSL